MCSCCDFRTGLCELWDKHSATIFKIRQAFEHSGTEQQLKNTCPMMPNCRCIDAHCVSHTAMSTTLSLPCVWILNLKHYLHFTLDVETELGSIRWCLYCIVTQQHRDDPFPASAYNFDVQNMDVTPFLKTFQFMSLPKMIGLSLTFQVQSSAEWEDKGCNG